MEHLQHLADSTSSLATSTETGTLPFAAGATGWSLVLSLLVAAALLLGGLGFVLTAGDDDV